MIRINLTPPEELENSLWYLPDVVFLLLFAIIGYSGVEFYLNDLRVQTEIIQQETAKVEDEIRTLSEDVNRHKHLEGEIKDFETKLADLSAISESKVHKHRPIIVLEHLQNLRPRGVWFESLQVKARDKAAKDDKKKKNAATQTVSLTGMAFDNLMVAEFMSHIRSTRNQDFDPTDFRTYIYFGDLELKSTVRQDASTLRDRFIPRNTEQGPLEPVEASRYTLNFTYSERKDDSPLPLTFEVELDSEAQPVRIARLR